MKNGKSVPMAKKSYAPLWVNTTAGVGAMAARSLTGTAPQIPPANSPEPMWRSHISELTALMGKKAYELLAAHCQQRAEIRGAAKAANIELPLHPASTKAGW